MAGTGASGSGAYGELLVTSLVVLAGVCVLAYLVVRFARRYLGGTRSDATGLLDVIARVPLEPRRSLYVVEVAGKALLVGTSEMGLTVLSELDREAVRARPVAERRTFAELVQAAWGRRRDRRGAAEGAGAGTGTGTVAESEAAAVAAPEAAAVATPEAAAEAAPEAAAEAEVEARPTDRGAG